MRGADVFAEILKREGVSFVVGFPENLVFDAAARLGIRPLIARTERVAVNIADGYSRMTNGKKIGVALVQEGPGAEAAFGAIAQAFSDNSPILVIAGSYDRPLQGFSPYFGIGEAYNAITRATIQVNDKEDIVPACRRAFSALRRGPGGPVVISPARDLLYEDVGDWEVRYSPVPGCRSLPDPADIAEIARALSNSQRPVIVAGQGIFYAEATGELVELAEAFDIPVMTTLNGKSAFPENHRLSLGTGGRSRPEMVDYFLANSDFILALGTSLTRSHYITPIPDGKTIAQITSDPSDIGKCYDVAFAAVGDAKSAICQLLDQLKDNCAPLRPAKARGAEVSVRKAEFLSKWEPRSTSDAEPISPYRVISEVAKTVDLARTVLTHDSGNPRDQIVPFFEATTPHGYMGWGKSTQLGSGLGLMLGAKLARPDWLAINIMGDAAFGMVAADIETGARLGIPITTIVMNNGVLGGYGEYMPIATKEFMANRVSGNYSALAASLGLYTEVVRKPEEISSALKRCLDTNLKGKSALLEIITREEPVFPLG